MPHRADAWWLETLLVRHQRRLPWISLALILLTAWTSETFYHKDEHYQIVEFVGRKLGLVSAHDMAWEYGAQIRPWLQPAFYYLLTKPLFALGLDDRFTLVWVMRVASGMLTWTAILSLLRASAGWFASDESRTWSLRWLTLIGCIPFLAVRTSSETFSAALLIFGIAVLTRDLPAEARSTPTALVPWRALVSGLLLGLAFECRYQVAFCIVGVWLWLAFVARARVLALALVALGVLAAIGVGTLVDRWGYGAWVFAPWSYVKVNLFEGKASEFGTNWFGAYLHMCLANVFAPEALLAIVGLALCWIRRPRHLVTFATLPFVLAHCLLSHKEDRFLFPIVLLSFVAAALGFEAQQPSSVERGLQRFAARVAELFRAFRPTWAYRGLVLLNAALLLGYALWPLAWRSRLGFAQWAYHELDQPAYFVQDEEMWDLSYPFYRRVEWTFFSKDEWQNGAVAATAQPLYLLVRQPFTPPEGYALGVEPHLLYSEFPGSDSAWFRQTVFPALGRLRATLGSRGFPATRLTWVSAYALPQGSERQALSQP